MPNGPLLPDPPRKPPLGRSIRPGPRANRHFLRNPMGSDNGGQKADGNGSKSEKPEDDQMRKLPNMPYRGTPRQDAQEDSDLATGGKEIIVDEPNYRKYDGFA